MTGIPDGIIHLCVTDPPYFAVKRFSDNAANLCTHKNPFPALERVFREVLRVLKRGGYFCLNVSDVPSKTTDTLTTFPYDLMNLCRKIGFELKNTIIWDKGDWVGREKSNGYGSRFNHEYVWVLEKP